MMTMRKKTECKITFLIIPLLCHCSSQVDCVDYSTKGKWIDPQPLQSFVPVSLGKIWNPKFLQVAVPSAVMECNKVHAPQYNFELPVPILKSSFLYIKVCLQVLRSSTTYLEEKKVFCGSRGSCM